MPTSACCTTKQVTSSRVTIFGKIPPYQGPYKFFKLLSSCLILDGHTERFKLSASWVRTDLRGVPRYTLQWRNMWSFCERATLNYSRNQAQSMMVMVMKKMMTTILIIHRIHNFDSGTVTYGESKQNRTETPQLFTGCSLCDRNRVSHNGRCNTKVPCIILW